MNDATDNSLGADGQPPVELISVEVAYALPDKQRLLTIKVPAGCSPLDAAQRSGIAGEFTEVDLAAAKMGVFGKAVDANAYALREGDRVEIYRPLLVDPKEVRKARAARSKQEKSS